MLNQKEICEKFNASFFPSNENEKVGVALETIGLLPINALRHPPENGTCGWYIWCGESFSESPEFFKPLHVSHLSEHLPEIVSYLSLPPGFRVLLAGSYEDVWFDSSLLNI
uniref:immunity protein Imm33 domain-containing protein n=1 Tax=Cellvibrio fontiphilus TaxID=1815559 RepID=UPI002B4BF61C|nr:hypothetical protein [Cellvibrio fontiphilus]